MDKQRPLDNIKREFGSLPYIKQRDILFLYIDYVTDYPEYHDRGSYPACFWEWYTSDYDLLTATKTVSPNSPRTDESQVSDV